VSGDEAGIVRVSSLDVGKELFSCQAPSAVAGLALNSSDRRLVGLGKDGSARVWHSDSGVLVRQFPPTPESTGAALSRDGRWLAVCAQSQLHLWDTETGSEFQPTTPYPADPLCMAFDFSGRRIAVCGSNWVVICETETGTALFRIDRGLDTLSFSPDGKTIAFSANYDGNRDVYLVPSLGGIATRLTYHGMSDRVVESFNR